MTVTIISADINSGKTTYAKHLIEKHKEEYLGFLSLSNKKKDKFYLYDINDGNKILIMSECGDKNYEKLGRFYLEPGAFDKAYDLLINHLNGESFSKTVLIDEVGRLELKGRGFNALISKLIEMNVNLVLCVRKVFVEDVISKYKFENCSVIDVEYNESFK